MYIRHGVIVHHFIMINMEIDIIIMVAIVMFIIATIMLIMIRIVTSE